VPLKFHMDMFAGARQTFSSVLCPRIFFLIFDYVSFLYYNWRGWGWEARYLFGRLTHVGKLLIRTIRTESSQLNRNRIKEININIKQPTFSEKSSWSLQESNSRPLCLQSRALALHYRHIALRGAQKRFISQFVGVYEIF